MCVCDGICREGGTPSSAAGRRRVPAGICRYGESLAAAALLSFMSSLVSTAVVESVTAAARMRRDT